jgi:translation elongation factor EF-1alpha
VLPGDNVAIRVPLNVEDICKGFVICQPKNECSAVKMFEAFL